MEKTQEELIAEQLEAEIQAKAEAEAKEKTETEEKEKHEMLKSLSDEEKLKHILQLRKESRARRLKEEELTAKLAEFEKKQAEEIEKDKKAKGKYEEIISDYKKKLEDLEPLADKYKNYIDSKTAEIKKTLEEKKIWKESFAKLSLEDLEDLASVINKQTTVKTDNSNTFVKNNGKDERTPEEKMAGLYKKY